jgi:hypothetical protein
MLDDAWKYQSMISNGLLNVSKTPMLSLTGAGAFGF